MPSILELNTSGLFTMTAAQVAHYPLLAPVIDEQNYLTFHAYLILYAIAPFVRIFPTDAVIMTIYVLSSTATIVLAYFALRRAGISIAFCFLVMLHPAWAQGIQAQFYSDRIFVFSGLLLMQLTSAPVLRRWGLVAAPLLCLLLHDGTRHYLPGCPPTASSAALNAAVPFDAVVARLTRSLKNVAA